MEQKENEENIWRRKSYFFGGEEKRRKKRREMFGEGKYILIYVFYNIFAEKKKNCERK